MGLLAGHLRAQGVGSLQAGLAADGWPPAQELRVAAQQQQAALHVLTQQPWAFLPRPASSTSGCQSAPPPGTGGARSVVDQLETAGFVARDSTGAWQHSQLQVQQGRQLELLQRFQRQLPSGWQQQQQQQQQQQAREQGPATLFRPKAHWAKPKPQQESLAQAGSLGSGSSSQSALTGMRQGLVQPLESPSMQS